jgi:hypothetical protein
MCKGISSNVKLSDGTKNKVESVTVVIDGNSYTYDRKFLRYLMEDIENGEASPEAIEWANALQVLLA